MVTITPNMNNNFSEIMHKNCFTFHMWQILCIHYVDLVEYYHLRLHFEKRDIQLCLVIFTKIKINV